MAGHKEKGVDKLALYTITEKKNARSGDLDSKVQVKHKNAFKEHLFQQGKVKLPKTTHSLIDEPGFTRRKI